MHSKYKATYRYRLTYKKNPRIKRLLKPRHFIPTARGKDTNGAGKTNEKSCLRQILKNKVMQIDHRQTLHHLRQLIKYSGDLIDQIPHKGDDIPTVTLKVINLTDKLVTYFVGHNDSILSFFERLNVDKRESMNFVRLFFNALITPECSIKRIPIDSDAVCVTVTVPGSGTLYFIENTYDGKREDYWGTFYYSKDFDFRSLLSTLWDKYEGRIYVSLDDKDRGWQKLTSFTSFPLPYDTIYGSSVSRLEELKNKNDQYRTDGIPRTYLLLGEPGTGKSSFAVHMAAADDHIIKFDAKSLESLDADNMEFLLNNLRPEFIIIDDIDKIIFGSTISTLLYILESIKQKFPETTVIMTANEIDNMDSAMLRPGRVDEIMEFYCEKSDRKSILKGYLKIYNLSLTKTQLNKAIECTEGMTGAYIKEFAIQLKVSSFDEVYNNFMRRRRLLGFLEEKEDESEEEEKTKKKKKIKKRKKKSKKIKKNNTVNLEFIKELNK